MSHSPSAIVAHLGDIEPMVERRVATLDRDSIIERIWSRDPTVWGGDADTPELVNRLGWLDVADRTLERLPALRRIGEDAWARFDHIVLCGMGGSSLAPEVLHRVCGAVDGFPSFMMLDSTSPAAVRAAESGQLDRTLFLISSKSGSTLETMSFYRYLWRRTGGVGEQFMAITDPGTSLDRLGRDNDFRAVVPGESEVGGRFSALSAFGMLPAVLFGANADGVLQSARTAMQTCQRTSIDATHGAWLGALLGEGALASRDKLMIRVSPTLHAFGLWLEQLIAESTGKLGRGILPVVTDRFPDPASVANDRLFISLGLRGEGASSAGDSDPLVAAGHPVVSLELADAHAIGGEFFRWEFATAVAGAILGVNPFDQPDVAASKANTERVLAKGTPLPPSADPAYVKALVRDVPKRHYLAVLAYVTPSEESERRLAKLARRLERRLGVAVTTGIGPRYLHSTGQLHKGGPPTGHFLHVVDVSTDDDLSIPGAAYGFQRLLEAQAIGDWQALQQIGRPIALIHGLDRLEAALG